VIEYFLETMGIVFYSHRVNYPRALSAQVLPKELKNQIIDKLENIRDRVDDFELVKNNDTIKKVTHQQIQDNINFLKADDLSEYWQDCLEFNRRLDATRKQGPIEKIISEFKPYV